MGKKLEIKSGQRFNKLIVIKEVDRFIQPSGQPQRGFLCKCDCGKTKVIRLSHLIHNRVRSCGCLTGEFHGDSHTQLHNTYRAMKNRCYNSNYHEYYLYGGRGIKICKEWENSYLTFKGFALKNGYKEGLWIDRINNYKGYSPDNCRFVNAIESVNNRRDTYCVNYNNKKIAFMLLLREKGLYYYRCAIRSRILRGWSVEKAVDTPITKGNYHRTNFDAN